MPEIYQLMYRKVFYFCICLSRQSHTTMTTQDIGQTINATNVVEGVSPFWNEMIYADIAEEDSHSEGR